MAGMIGSLKMGRLKSFRSTVVISTEEEEGEERRSRLIISITVGPIRTARVLVWMRAIFLGAVEPILNVIKGLEVREF